MQKEATLTSKGQITIPLEIRRQLQLKQGDIVVFEATSGGVTLRRSVKPNAFSRYAGRYREGQGKSREEINRAVRELRGE